MSDIEVNQLLAEMRTLTAQAKTLHPTVSQNREAAPAADFAGLLKQSLDQVNGLQQHSAELKTGFERGNAEIGLADVMIASQKAAIAFQGTVQVRNKLVDAYQEIMRMSV